MPINPRIRDNNVFGTVADNPLLAGALVLNSGGLVNLSAVVSKHAVITLDPLRQYGSPEIIVVTNHSPSATTATIQRGAYGTIQRQHPQGTLWVHAPLNEDFILIVTSSTRPVDPYEGQMVYETDTHRPVQRDNTQWLPGGNVSIVSSATRPANPYAGQMIFETDTDRVLTRDAANANWVRTGWTTSAGRTGVRLRRVANQSIPNGGGGPTLITWDTEDFDSDGFIATPATSIIIPAGLGGLYSVTCKLDVSANFSGRCFLDLQLTTAALTYRIPIPPVTEALFATTIVVQMAAAETFSVGVFQTTGGAINVIANTRLEMNRIGA